MIMIFGIYQKTELDLQLLYSDIFFGRVKVATKEMGTLTPCSCATWSLNIFSTNIRSTNLFPTNSPTPFVLLLFSLYNSLFLSIFVAVN